MRFQSYVQMLGKKSIKKGKLNSELYIQISCVISLLLFIISCESKLDQSNNYVYVYAASSLDKIVEHVNRIYEARYPDRKVITSLVGSQTARLQLENGATPGIFISADIEHINRLQQQGKIERSSLLAYHQIAVLTQESSKVYSLNDLLLDHGTIGLGAKVVPVGKFAWQVIKAYQDLGHDHYIRRLSKKIGTQELSARALMGRLKRKEVTSAFLYKSDLSLLDKVREVVLPRTLQHLIKVPVHIALSQKHKNSTLDVMAKDWFEIILSWEGHTIIKSYGLELPKAIKHNENQSRH